MNAPPSPPGAQRTYESAVKIGALVPRSHGADRARTAESWPRVAIEGTRGQMEFSHTPGISVWQWAWAPIQVIDRDPAEPDHFRILHASRWELFD
jgi:hypothetical protein